MDSRADDYCSDANLPGDESAREGAQGKSRPLLPCGTAW